MARITIGVAIHPQHTTAPELLRAFQQADALGVDRIWTWDHFFPLTGDPNGPQRRSSRAIMRVNSFDMRR